MRGIWRYVVVAIIAIGITLIVVYQLEGLGATHVVPLQNAASLTP